MLFNPMRRNGSFDNGLLSQYVISGSFAFISVIYTWWITPPFPWPFNTIDFGYSTARRFAISACTAIAKVHPFEETPSSSIQHVKKLSLLKFVLLLQDTPSLSCVFVKTFEIFIYICAGWQLATIYSRTCHSVGTLGVSVEQKPTKFNSHEHWQKKA